MKFVKWFIILVAVLLGLFLVITFFLPTDYKIERTVEIEAPAAIVYSQVADLEVWQEWNPWNEMDPDMVIEYGETTVGPGATYTWTSEVAGNGEMTILEATPHEHVRFELIFEGYEDLPSYSSIYMDSGENPETTTVTWTFEGNVGDSFFARWMTVMVDKFVGASYEKGLNMLKERCEALASDPQAVLEKVPLP